MKMEYKMFENKNKSQNTFIGIYFALHGTVAPSTPNTPPILIYFKLIIIKNVTERLFCDENI